jgi:DNA-binding transcriptional ArsR family regulator
LSRIPLVLAAIPLLAVARLLPAEGLGLAFRLAAASLCLLIPGALIARALRLPAVAEAVALSLGVLFLGMLATFALGTSILVTLVVLGRGRAAVLLTLDAPRSTIDVARRLEITPGGASQHLSSLKAAGLVSSSPVEVVRPLAGHFGVAGVLATRARIEDGRYTGELEFYCYGDAKAEAIRSLAEERGIELDVLPTAQRHGMGILTYSPLAGGWLSGRWRKDAGQQTSSRAGRLPERFDLANPYNQRKLDAVEELAKLADEAGLTLIQLAIGFAQSHPAITSPLIGPRTMEHLETQLAAADVVLSDDVLDRIDEIVPPGTTINPADSSFNNPALEPAARRR